MIMQELLELTDAEIMARVTARKPAAKLVKSVQHLQRSWLQVIRALHKSCGPKDYAALVPTYWSVLLPYATRS